MVRASKSSRAGSDLRSPCHPALGSRIARVAIWVIVVGIARYELLLITLHSRPDAVDRCLHLGLPAGLQTRETEFQLSGWMR